MRTAACLRVQNTDDMGLKSGQYGVKATLVRSFSEAFRTFETCVDARDTVLDRQPSVPDCELSNRAKTAQFLDGNVLLRSVPESACKFGAFCTIVYNYVREALRTASLVIVVFDEPECLTGAKLEEQARRDATRASHAVQTSSEFDCPTIGDDLTEEMIHSAANVHAFIDDRVTRVRFFDAAVMHLFKKLSGVMNEWTKNGHSAGTLLIDGIDPRACGRTPGDRRNPQLFGTNEEAARLFAHPTPIGEGDLKLQAHDVRLRHLQATTDAWKSYVLCMQTTIDTDTFAICLLDVARRRCESDDPGAFKMQSLFVMRQAAFKRKKDDEEKAKASFLACDVVLLEDLLQKHMWSLAPSMSPNVLQRRNAMIAFVGCAALCGCDFTVNGLQGSRFDHFFESLPSFLAHTAGGDALRELGMVLDAGQEDAQEATLVFRRICEHTSQLMWDKPRYKKQAKSVSEVAEELLLRYIWSVCYWSQKEYSASHHWGFL